jgi:hypothetical protein
MFNRLGGRRSDAYHLESGAFDFFQVVGISEAEAAFARSHDGSALLKLLIKSGQFPVTDPNRTEVAIPQI